PHRDGGQAQFIERPLDSTDVLEPLSQTLAWMERHLDAELTVEQLARRAAMSSRTFARRFRAATGTTPHRWLLRERLRAARELLETTDASIAVVAQRSGLGSAANLRLRFQAELGTSPSAYRRTFAG